MKQYLIKFSGDYADEFDVQGFRVLREDQYAEFVERVKNAQYPQEVYFGTNEYIEFYSASSYLSGLEVEEISDNEAEVLLGLFGDEYGTFLEPEDEDPDE
jgi:hypothetical protein